MYWTMLGLAILISLMCLVSLFISSHMISKKADWPDVLTMLLAMCSLGMMAWLLGTTWGAL